MNRNTSCTREYRETNQGEHLVPDLHTARLLLKLPGKLCHLHNIPLNNTDTKTNPPHTTA